MIDMDYTVIIPSRLASKRLPNKALENINGYPMIVHVAKRSMLSMASRVVVATPDHRIHWVCKDHGIETVDTSADHKNGTERLLEAAHKLGLKADDIVVNVQGDEPLVNPIWINKVAEHMHEYNCQAVVPYQYTDERDNLNRVKLVHTEGRIIYMSRLPVPYTWDVPMPSFKHLSVVGFRAKTLETFYDLGEGNIERQEKIEMLRLIENGIPIHTFRLSGDTVSVDTPDDLERARALEPLAVKWR